MKKAMKIIGSGLVGGFFGRGTAAMVDNGDFSAAVGLMLTVVAILVLAWAVQRNEA